MIRTASIALTVGVLFVPSTFAQTSPIITRGREIPATVTIDFKGGTVEEYVRLIEREFDGKANIVLEADAAPIKITGVKLTVSSAHSAAAAVEYLEIDGSKVHLFTRGGPEFRVIGVEKPQPTDEEFHETHVWTFASFIDGGIAANDALSAIENALDLTGGRADVRYHEDTQLLMVNGTQSQLDAVDQVVSRLNGVATWRENQARDEAQVKVDKEAQGMIRGLEVERDTLMRRIGELELHLIRLQNELDK